MYRTIFVALVGTAVAGTAIQAMPAVRTELSDVEMAHVAVTANDTDIRYAHLALALSDNPGIRNFAETMIRDHSAVNEGVAALASKLGVTAKDNAVSRELRSNAMKITNELSGLRGAEFDRRYAANEAAYHQSVNELVATQFIPNAKNPEVRKAFQDALAIFRGHQQHAEQLDRELREMDKAMGTRGR